MPSEKLVADILADWLEASEEGRAEEFDALVARHPEHESALREGLAAVALVDFGFEKRATVEPDVPERVGSYRVLGVLGDGGMGTVYEAVAEAGSRVVPSGRKVAVKRVHEHLLKTPGFHERFHQEAEAGRRVEDPNVVRTYGIDEDRSGPQVRHLLVMEYVQGQTLGDLLDELNHVPEDLCKHIAARIAKGLRAIHEANMVHRDLKPENVILTEGQEVKLMDLGVAWLADARVRLSKTGMFLGSVLYAAPEQFQSVPVDGRADLYALGLILYELVAGHHPHAANDTAHVIRNQLEEEPRRVGEINPQVSPFLEEVIHTLIEKRREHRFRSAAEFERVLANGEQGDWWQERARRLKKTTRRPLRRIRIPRETRLYGRDAELDELDAIFDRVKEGDGQVLLLEGEAGIGKSRLVDEFGTRLEHRGEEFHFLFGSYPPGGRAEEGALSVALREHFGETDLAEALSDRVGPSERLVPALAAALLGEPVPEGADPLTTGSLHTLVTRILQSLASERPTILLLDDLHFASADGRAMFCGLARAARDHRLLVIGSQRLGERGRVEAVLERLDHARILSLARLGPKDLALLLREAFHSEKLAARLGLRIALKSDGNPLFVFEIIRSLREEGRVSRRPDGSWATTQEGEDIQVPASVTELIRSRLGELREEERHLLDLAACVGFRFDALLITDALKLPRIPALRSLARVERVHHLVRSAGKEYVFDHHHVREVLYDSLPPLLRESYHALLGKAIETQATRDGTDGPAGAQAFALARHHLLGGRGESALPYLDRAFQHLQAACMNDEALELCTLILRVDGLLDGAERLRRLSTKFRILELTGRREEAAAMLAEMRDVAEGLDDPGAVWNLRRLQGQFLCRDGRLREARDIYRELLPALRELGDDELEIATHNDLGNVELDLGRSEEAAEHFTEAARLATEVGNEDALAACLINLGCVLSATGKYAAAEVQYEEGLRLARSCGNRRWEANALGSLGAVRRNQGRFEEAEALLRRWLDLAQQIGAREAEASAVGALGTVHLDQGHHTQAQKFLEQSLALHREVGSAHGEAKQTGNLGNLFFGTGNLEQALRYCTRDLELATAGGWRTDEAVAAGNVANIFTALGRHDEARPLLERSRRIGKEIGNVKREGYVFYGLARLEDGAGNHVDALQHVRDSIRVRRVNGDAHGLATSLVFLGQLLQRKGEEAEARAALEEALDLCHRQGRGGQAAAALVVLACLQGGDADAAEAALLEADANDQEMRFLLWTATGDARHLKTAKKILDDLVDHAPEEYRESTLRHVWLHREIMKAWEEHGRTAWSGESAT